LDKTSGFDRYYLFCHQYEAIFYPNKIAPIASTYRYGYKIDTDEINSPFYHRVMNLCLKPINRDPMGGDRFLVNILGLTPNDIFKFDFASFIDLEDRIVALENSYRDELAEKANSAAKLKQEISK
jgi:hypothetical protein